MKRRIWISLLLIFIIFSFVFMYGGEYYIEQQIHQHLNQEYGSVLEVENVDVGWFSRDIQVKNPTLLDENRPVAEAKRLRVRPQLRSLFSKNWVIKEVLVEDVTFTIRSLEEGFSFEHTLQELQQGDHDENEQSTSIMINRLVLLNAHLEYFQRNSTAPDFRISPVQLVLSPIHFSDSPPPIDLRAAMRPDSDRPPVVLTGTIPRTIDGPLFQGNLQLDQFRLRRFSSFLPSPYQLKDGNLSGDFPVTINQEKIQIKQSTWKLNNSHILYDTDFESDQPEKEAQADSHFTDWLTWEKIHVELQNTKFSYGSHADSSTISSTAGFVEIPPFQKVESRIDIKGGFELLSPRGKLIYDLRIPVQPGNSYDIFAEGNFPQVKDLNPYLFTTTNFQMNRGSLQAATRGGISPDNLDLKVGLKFDRLQLKENPKVKKGLFQIPTATLTRYLSKQDGSLEVNFQVGGTPAEPTIDISDLRRRVVTNLGIDAAIIGTLGLPFYLGDRALEKTTGISVFGEVSDRLGSVFKGSKSIRKYKKPDTGTAIPSPSKNR